MSRCSRPLSASVSLFLGLTAFTVVHAQEPRPIAEFKSVPHSILSLASAPRPTGQVLARKAGDATFEHIPANYHVFAAATTREDAGVETLRLNFAAATRLTKITSKNRDFVVESGGTCRENSSYSQGDSCSLMVRFNPQGPGHRVGSLNISHTAEATPMFVGLAGNGYAPVVSFTPSQIVTVAGTASGTTGTIKSSTNLAIDGGDILYIPDIGNNLIKEIDSSGTINTVTPFFATPASLVADSAGFLYSLNTPSSTYYFSFFTPYGSQTAYATTYAAGSCTPSTPCAFGTVGMSRPANINIDPYDNLFFEEGTKGAAEMPVANISGGSGSFNLWYLTNSYVYLTATPSSFAVDGNDNLYNFYSYAPAHTCYLQEESAYSAEYSPTAKRVAGGSVCGFSGDGGQARGAEISSSVGQITFDVAGNLYFADAGNQRVRRIDAATGIINTIAGNGVAGVGGDGNAATAANLSNPSGLAVDSLGQVYILNNAPTAGPTQSIRKVTTLGYWNYGTQFKGVPSAAKVFTVSNTGNTSLVLSSNVLLTGNADFSIDPLSTNCVLTAGATLAAGRSCFIGVKFTPAVTGVRSTSLTLLDNTLTGSNVIRLVGTGTLPPPTMKITAPAAGSSVKTGTTVTFSVSVTSATTPVPTGTVTFKVNGANIGSPVTLSGAGTASTTFTQSSAATYTLSAVYSGDANYGTATVSESLIETAVVKAASTVSLSQGATALSCSSSAFSVRVASGQGSSPTGTVQLKSGTSVLATALLSGGKASLSLGKLSGGVHTFTASYGGDSSHLPALSAPLKVTVSSTGATCSGVGGPVETPIRR